MKFSIKKSLISKVLNHCQGVVGKRHLSPILSAVRIEAKEGKITCNATDLDLDIVESIETEVEKEGIIAINASVLHEIIKTFKDEDIVSFDASDPEFVILKSGRSRFKLALLSYEDFPIIKHDDIKEDSFQVPVSVLTNLFDKTKSAMSTDESRYYINGIFLHIDSEEGEEVVKCVATDGHRMSSSYCEKPEGMGRIRSVIIPRKTVNEFSKVLDKHEGDVVIGIGDTKISFSFDNTIFTSKLVEGNFPDYKKVIPENNPVVVNINKADFSNAVEAVSKLFTNSVAGRNAGLIKLSLTDDHLTISSQTEGDNNAEIKLQVEGELEDMEIGFNYKYLLDVLSSIDGETLSVLLKDNATPAIVKQKDDNSSLHIIMPMRIW